MKAAIRDPDPVLYFEHKHLYRRLSTEKELGAEGVTPIGRAHVQRKGTGLTIATFGAMVHVALEAAERLADEDGADVEVLDLRTLRPLDEKMILESVRKTGRLLVLHEAPRFGGFGGEVAAMVCETAFEWLDAPVRRVAALDTPVPYAGPLEEAHLPRVADVVLAAREQLNY